MIRLGSILAVLLVLASCQVAPDSARAQAEAFLDAHYVAIDLAASRALCSGLALDKVEREIELTSKVSIQGDTHKPRINYSFSEARESPDRVQFVYELSVRVAGLEPFTKIVMLTLRSDDGSWSVSNYGESDPQGRR